MDPGTVTLLSGLLVSLRKKLSTRDRLRPALSDGQPKQPVDKLQLREWIAFPHPSVSLPNHVQRLDSL
jgi:hypothetical protein